jgi:hypothetical protein
MSKSTENFPNAPESSGTSSEYELVPADVLRDITLRVRLKPSLHMKAQGVLSALRCHAYTLWSEVRSLFHRIRSQPNKMGCIPIKRLREIWPSQNLPECIATLSSSDCIKQLTERLPWASLSDASLYQEGWEAGALSCVRRLFPEDSSACTGQKYTQTEAHSSR